MIIEEFIRADVFRRHAAEKAKQVAQTGKPLAIGTTIGRPRYLLRPSRPPKDHERCVRLGPDELRRHYTEIRALIRLDGIPFGILVDGEVQAVLTRHPTYRPDAALNYRQIMKQQEGVETGEATSLENRVLMLETALAAVVDRLANVECSLPHGIVPSKVR